MLLAFAWRKGRNVATVWFQGLEFSVDDESIEGQLPVVDRIADALNSGNAARLQVSMTASELGNPSGPVTGTLVVGQSQTFFIAD